MSYSNSCAKSNCALLSWWVTGKSHPCPNFPKRKIKKSVLSLQYKKKKKKKSYCQLILESFRFSMPVFALHKCLLGLIGSIMSPIARIFIALLRNYRTYQPTVNSLPTQVLPNHTDLTCQLPISNPDPFNCRNKCMSNIMFKLRLDSMSIYLFKYSFYNSCTYLQ